MDEKRTHATHRCLRAPRRAGAPSPPRSVWSTACPLRAGRWAETVLATAQAAGAGRIHVADDVSGYASARLGQLERDAAGARVTVVRHPGITAVEPAAVRGPGGGPYQVFTPYYRRWLAAAWRPRVAAPARITLAEGISAGRLPRLADLSTAPPAAVTARGGESEGLARMRRWSTAQLAEYEDRRDDLAADATSRLSAYLHFGCLSPLALAAEMSARPGGAAFVRQLAWRDFFHQALAARPDAAWRDYRDRGGHWRDDPEALAAWQEAHDYPIEMMTETTLNLAQDDELLHGLDVAQKLSGETSERLETACRTARLSVHSLVRADRREHLFGLEDAVSNLESPGRFHDEPE